ncbi:hypothetical protein BLJAPNOD_05133 [Ensifer sp. M14]|jgi:hypothetical protein|uniref:DUF6894 family protein n=1 Tax=Sinorhizobium/Ensifer group TaxID=227292 RepID=UPI00098685BD|nr:MULTISPECIES: hypothetical protein [Sinorhizobium/Ensifer group]OOG72910.1 hypothetical protein B0E45_07945 [Sinorhizobium sp. A49]RDL47907.1 hypothetical protein BLJAPNOD_05133 [Ensifer sp. M14]
MTRYFFDLNNGDGKTVDEEGQELGSRNAIMQEVTRILVDVARDELAVGQGTEISVSVRTDVGKAVSVATLTFENEWLD